MTEIPQIVLPHGGYRKLTAFQKSEIVYQMTVVFCRRFLSAHGDHTVDQMTQAARSCKQNIAEGSASSGTSKETELKLTNVARASLDELLEEKAGSRSGWLLERRRQLRPLRRLARRRSFNLGSHSSFSSLSCLSHSSCLSLPTRLPFSHKLAISGL